MLSQENIGANALRLGSSFIFLSVSKLSRLREPHTAPTQGFGCAEYWQMNDTPDKEVAVFDSTKILIQKTSWLSCLIAGLLVLLSPVIRRTIRKVEARPFVPLLARMAFPAQAREVVKSYRSLRIANATPLVTPGSEQRNLNQLFGFVIPAPMGRAYEFTIIAPCVRE